MAKRLSRKLLSVILVIAICCTTVLGCLITASAAVSGTYTFGEAKINADATQATVDLTFEIPDGKFTAGMFTLNEENYDAAEHLILTDVSASGEISATFDTEDLDDGVIANVMVDAGESENVYSSATITLTFAFSNGEADRTKNYEISVSDIEFAYSVSNYYKSFTGVNCIIAAGCEHVVTVTGDPIKVDAKNGYSVYEDSVCANCKESLGYQVVPTQVPSDEIWYWDSTEDDTVLADNGETGSENDPIIIDSAEELHYLALTPGANWGADVSATKGKFFKIADGVDTIVLQPESKITAAGGLEVLTSLTTGSEVENYFTNVIQDPVNWITNNNQCVFSGNFDGNGAKIYGLYATSTSSAALFPAVDGVGNNSVEYTWTNAKGVEETATEDNVGVTYENIIIRNSYLTSTNRLGAIAGFSYGSTGAGKANGTLNFNSCEVSGCYMRGTGANKNTAATIFGNTNGEVIHVNNALVYNNDALYVDSSSVEYKLGIYGAGYDRFQRNDDGSLNYNEKGYVSSSRLFCTVENSIVLGNTPYVLTFGYNSCDKSCFENVYTDQSVTPFTQVTYTDSDIKHVEPAELVGSAAADVVTALNAANDGENIWTVDETGGYPLNVEVNTIGKNIVYAVGSATDGTQWNAADGSFMDIDGKTNVGTGTKDDPFIISTPGHMRYLAQNSTYATTHGKYFAVDPSIDVMVFQYESYVNKYGGIDAIMSLSADELKTFFETNTTDIVIHQGNTGTEAFGGHFDGNGVRFVGIYTGSWGLFGKVSEDATITNLTISNSYIKSGDYAGGIVGYAQCSITYEATELSNSNCPGVVSFENCTVYNNYIASTGDNQRVGALMGGSETYIGLKMSNCLVYGNDVVGLKDAANPVDMDCLFGAISSGHNGDTAGYPNGSYSDSIILDCVPYSSVQINQPFKAAYYRNIYTNMPQTEYTPSGSGSTPDSKVWDNYDITIINTSNISGVAAKDVLALDFENDWVLDLSEGYPTPKTPTASVINETSSTGLNLKAYNLTYNEDGSFNFNFYYTPQLSGFAPKLIVPQADLSGYMTLSPTALSDDEANALGVKAGTLRYTIERLSAREIPDTLLATVITEHAGTAAWGKTEAVSIRDYAVSVINGNYEQADKNVAAALINYGDASKAALETGYDYVDTEPNIVYAVQTNWNAADGSFMDIDGETNVGTGTKEDPFIVSTPGHMRYLAQNSTYATTHGKYFAVDPSIDVMVFQYESYVNKYGGIDAIMSLSADELKTFFEKNTTDIVTHQGNTGTEAFGGHFDGNGVRFVGIYTGSWGLFGKVSEDATITNLTISNSYIKSGDYAGGIVGYAQCSSTYTDTGLSNNNCPGVVSFEKCTVKNNYIASTGNNQRVGALMGGSATYIGLKMSNCLVYGNDVVGLKDAANPVDMDCLFGAISSGHNGDTAGYPNGSYSDSIILDCVPYSSIQLNQPFKAAYYRNIYTNMARTDYTPSGSGSTPDSRVWDNYDITIVSDVKGSNAVVNMPDLDWTNTWLYGYPGEYPSLAQGDVSTQTAGEIWYWDGSYEAIDTTAHAGNADDPYIIENAQQLNYVAMQMAALDTTGKYFKIADGVDAIVLQSSGAEAIMALDNADDVKAYFEKITPLDWMKNYGWVTFNGNFNGNGAAIYGLYATNGDSTYAPSLFPFVDGGGDGTNTVGIDYTGITIENVIIRNSCYINTGTNANNRMGAIAGHTYGPTGAGYVNGTVNFDTIEVSNCYMSTALTDKAGAGIVIANGSGEIININNALIYGNNATNTDGTNLPIVANAENGRTDSDEDFVYNKVTNSIILGTAPYNVNNFQNRMAKTEAFENVYTDAASGTITFNTTNSSGDFYTMTYTDSDIKHVEPAELVGSAAAGVVTALNAANSDKTVWYEGNAWGYPSFEPAGTMPSAIQSVYDSLSLTNYDEYGETDPEFSMYATSLNLKTNPYIAFTFAFNGDYKADRDNITVTFKTESKTITTTVGDGNGGVSAGWTNNAGAGRYHLYRLEDISVEDMCKDIKVTVTYNGTDYNFGTFSVEGFALDLMNVNKKAPCDYYATRAEAAKALLFYTQMVNECYGGER